MTDSSVIAKYKGVFTQPPRRMLSRLTVDGPIMGNGDLGVAMSGPASALRFWISKDDFWEARTPYPHGAPRPIGGLDIACPQLEGATYRIEQHIYDADVRAEFTQPSAGGLTLKVHSWTPASANLLIVNLSAGGADADLKIKLWSKEGRRSVNRSGQSDGCAWITREFTGDDVVFPCQAAVAMKVLGGPPAAGEMSLYLKAGQTRTLVLAVATNFDDADWLQAAQHAAIAADEAKIASLHRQHLDWWHAFWDESLVEIGDELIERYYYGSQYILACCSRNAQFPPGLWGNWVPTDEAAWAGDYHLNYNHQAPWWGVFSSNHVALADPYDTPILQYVPTGKANARKYLNCRGVYYEVGIGPRGLCTTIADPAEPPDVAEAGRAEDYRLFLGQKSNAIFCAANMIMRINCTLDERYTERVYPFLIEVADFWEDYLKLEDGRYVIHRDAYSEAGPWPGEGWQEIYEDFNCTTSLGLLRMLLGALLDISERLGRDEGRRAKWRDILTRLSDFPLADRDGRTVMLRAEKGYNSRRHGGPYILNGTVFPAGVVGPRKTPKLAEVLVQDAMTWNDRDWLDHGNGFNTTYPGAARLGVDPELILTKLRAKLARDGFANLWINQAGGGIEVCAGITAGINEMLLQSFEGSIRLFANWPRHRPARFEDLRAEGAFLVSAALADGTVRDVTILSEKGRPCTIENPWPGRGLKVIDAASPDREIPLQWQGADATFQTRHGSSYRIEPANG